MGVVSQEKENKVMEVYDNVWIELARRPPPEPEQTTSTDPKVIREVAQRNAQADATYRANPGVTIFNKAVTEVQGLFVDRVKFNPKAYNEKTQKYGMFEAINLNDENQKAAAVAANQELESVLQRERTRFLTGLQKGRDGDSRQAMELFRNGHIMEGIQAFIRSIPVIGDFLAVPGKMIAELISGNPVWPWTALRMIKQDRAMDGALQAIGVTDPNEMARIRALMEASTRAQVVDVAREMVPGKIYEPAAKEVKPVVDLMNGDPALKPLLKPGMSIVMVTQNGAPVSTTNPAVAMVIGSKLPDGKFKADSVVKLSPSGNQILHADVAAAMPPMDVTPGGLIGPAGLNTIRRTVSQQYGPDGKLKPPPQPPKTPEQLLAEQRAADQLLIRTTPRAQAAYNALMADPDVNTKLRAALEVRNRLNEYTAALKTRPALPATSAGMPGVVSIDGQYYQLNDDERRRLVALVTEDSSKTSQYVNAYSLRLQPLLGPLTQATQPMWEAVSSEYQETVREQMKAGPIGGMTRPTTSSATPTTIPPASEFKLDPQLEDAVRKYAMVRFTDLKGGDNSKRAEKVEEFVRKYTAMVESAGMPIEDQRRRAGEIAEKTRQLLKKLDAAGVAALPLAITAGPLPISAGMAPENTKWDPMKKEIQAALDVMRVTDQELLADGKETDNKSKQDKAAVGLLLPVADVDTTPTTSQFTPAMILAAVKSLGK